MTGLPQCITLSLFGEANHTADQVLEIFKSIVLREPSNYLLYSSVESIKIIYNFNSERKVKHALVFIRIKYKLECPN